MDFRFKKPTKKLHLSLKLIFTSTMLLIGSVAARAETVYAPAYCEPNALSLIIKNKTSEQQRFWTQLHLEEEIQEIVYEIEPKAQLVIQGSDFLTSKVGFSIKSLEKTSLEISAHCKGTENIPLSDLTSPQVSHWLPSSKRTVKIHLLNLFLKSNSVQLRAFNQRGMLVEKKVIQLEKYYDTQSLKWTLSGEASRIEVLGQERLHSLVLFDSQEEEKLSPAVVLKPLVLPTDPSKTYFLISTKENKPDEAFVIALDDPQKIATAREQIKNPDLEKIVVAGIELGNGGFNRAFLSRDKSPYSWSVNRVDAFADFAHIDCDGSPDITEDRLLQKLNEGGRICFWRYRIVKELSPKEVASGKIK